MSETTDKLVVYMAIVAIVCIWLGVSISAYIDYKVTIEAFKAGYEQVKVENRVVWKKLD